MRGKQRSLKQRKRLLFVSLSVLIGVLLAVLQAIGAFARLDGLLYHGAGDATGLDGIVTVLVLSIVPALAIVRLGSERGILAAIGILAVYYLAAWLLRISSGQAVPLAATSRPRSTS